MKTLLLLDGLTPVSAYATLRSLAPESPSFLLESAPLAGERFGRYSIIGWRPQRIVALDRVSAELVRLRVQDVMTHRVLSDETVPKENALSLLRRHAASGTSFIQDVDIPRVVDSAVGFVSYDFVDTLEHVGGYVRSARIAQFLDGATMVVFDALLQTVTVYASAELEMQAAVSALRDADHAPTHRL